MRYTFVKQHDTTDCAAACLAMICLHYKKETTLTKLRDLMNTDLKGTNFVGLIDCASQLGFETRAVKVDKEGLLSDYSKPCIANIITEEGLSHFIVIYKINKKVVIGDPAYGIRKIPIEEFTTQFTGVLLLLKPRSDFYSMKGDDAKDNGYRRYIKLLLPHKKLFMFSIIASIIITALGIISSLFNKIVLDEILPYKLQNMLIAVVAIFAMVEITKVVVSFLREFIMIYLSQRIDIALMLGYFTHIFELPMRFFATRKTGDIITRFSDAFTIKEIFTNIALTLFMDITMAVFTGIVLFNMNAGLFGITLILVMISLIMVFCFKHPYKTINIKQMQQASILNSEIIEGLRAIDMIKCNSIEQKELDCIENEYIKSLRFAFKEGKIANIHGLLDGMVSAIGSLLIMFFGITQVIKGEITIGTLMAFMTLSEFFLDPIGRLASLQLELQEANVSMKRVSEVLDFEKEQVETGTLKNYIDFKDKIVFKDVYFKYGSRDYAVKNINLEIPHGRKIAIIGKSGSGKSTLMKLLLKQYGVSSGIITVDGVDINRMRNSSIRENISFVPQSIQLFSKSVIENIRMVKPNATILEVEKSVERAHAKEFIEKLPMQYETILEESGEGLSGGEKQRIALAQMFLKNSELCILDEATANIDKSIERKIIGELLQCNSNKTVVIITHNTDIARECDLIYVMDEGEIVGVGTHHDLIKNNCYRQLTEGL